MCLSITTLGNFILSKIEKTKYPAPGKLYEINGSKMHIDSKGKGDITVIMTCGNGVPSAYTDFSLIHKEVSKYTRSCVYDRPGYGWSEHTISPRTTEQIVEDLRSLLEKSNEKPPYLFVAHSFGAMEALLYSYIYPQEVSGIVLIDGISPLSYMGDMKPAISKGGNQVIRLLNQLGILRVGIELNLIPCVKERLCFLPKDLKKMEKTMIYKNTLNDMVIKERQMVSLSAENIEDKLHLGLTPLTVITASQSLKKLKNWEENQNSLLKLSNNSRQIIIPDANHVSIQKKHSKNIAAIIKEHIINLHGEEIL